MYRARYTLARTPTKTSVSSKTFLDVGAFHLSTIIFTLGEEFLINLGRHEKSTAPRATDEEDPNGTPAECLLQWTDGKKTDRCSDGACAINKAGDGAQRLVASTDRGVGGQISSDGTGNDVVGATDEDAHDAKHDK